jgi:hypothetical protein
VTRRDSASDERGSSRGQSFLRDTEKVTGAFLNVGAGLIDIFPTAFYECGAVFWLYGYGRGLCHNFS